jgi:hypothetical protein
MNGWETEVEAALRATRGIISVGWLVPADRQEIRKMEEVVEKEGLALAGTYRNVGILDVLERRHVCAVLNNNDFRHATEPALAWICGDVVIGEEIVDDDRLEALCQSGNVKVLGKNFVLYFDRIRQTRGQKPNFVVKGLAFPEIEHLSFVADVLSASPIGSADLYLKKRFGWPEEDLTLGTILIGFNMTDE